MNDHAMAEREARTAERLAATIQRNIDDTIKEMDTLTDPEEIAEYRDYLNSEYARRDNALDRARDYRDPAYIRQLESDDFDARNNAAL